MPELTGHAGIIAIVLLLAACAGGTDASPSDGSPASAAASDDAAVSDEASPVVTCPNPHGGVCLGELNAGTYTTQVFETPLTYTVPDGWANFEDLPGNFLVVPPTSSLEGVDAGTADYLGVYDGMAVASGDCFERPQAGVDPDPDAMAAWFGDHDGLETTEPVDVEVGGLSGVVMDVRVAEGYTGTCPYAPDGMPIVPLIIGAGPAGLHHNAGPGMITRLYLLEGQEGRVLAIELSDVEGGVELEELDMIVEDFVFTTDN